MKAFFRFIILFCVILVGGVVWLVLHPPVQEEPMQEHTKIINKFERKVRKSGKAENLISFSLLKETAVPFRGPIKYPKKLLAMDGEAVSMVGFMTPYDDLDVMKNFMVMNASVGCNFCAPPEMEEVMFVRQVKEDGGFVEGAILVSGVLKLDLPTRDPDEMHDTFFYVIDQAQVTPLE